MTGTGALSVLLLVQPRSSVCVSSVNMNDEEQPSPPTGIHIFAVGCALTAVHHGHIDIW